jgi:hypothetical protein
MEVMKGGEMNNYLLKGLKGRINKKLKSLKMKGFKREG